MQRGRQVWGEARSSLWLRPTFAVVVALAGGIALSAVEPSSGSWLDRVAFDGSVDDARGLLTVVVGTMITVTSLVFALTVVALQIASTQFSPRLLRSFLRDRGTQLVLSTFVGTVAYALAGLHQVGRLGPGGEAFVPRVAVSGALVLALGSVGMLVYYIQHVTDSIRIDTIMRRIEATALAVLDRDHPPRDVAVATVAELQPPSSATVVRARQSGYLQDVDGAALAAAGSRVGLCVRFLPLVGYFVVAGRLLASVWRDDGRPVAQDVADDLIAGHVELARDRHAEQEVGVGLRHLVDIANRASAPSTQDVYTAVQAVHHLSVVLSHAATRSFAPRTWRDRDGVARVQLWVMAFATHLAVVCDHVRQGGGNRHPRIALALLRLLEVVGERAAPDDRRAVLHQVDVVASHADEAIDHGPDREEVRATAAAVRRALAG